MAFDRTYAGWGLLVSIGMLVSSKAGQNSYENGTDIQPIRSHWLQNRTSLAAAQLKARPAYTTCTDTTCTESIEFDIGNFRCSMLHVRPLSRIMLANLTYCVLDVIGAICWRKCHKADSESAPYLSSMGDTFLISGLREKRSAVAGRIVDLHREADKLQADLVHIDAVLRLYGLEPAEIPTKGRMPVRSAYFGRNEVSRRCRDMLREKGTIKADDVSARAMQEKGA